MDANECAGLPERRQGTVAWAAATGATLCGGVGGQRTIRLPPSPPPRGARKFKISFPTRGKKGAKKKTTSQPWIVSPHAVSDGAEKRWQ